MGLWFLGDFPVAKAEMHPLQATSQAARPTGAFAPVGQCATASLSHSATQ